MECVFWHSRYLMNALFCYATDGAFVGGCVLRGVVACGFVVYVAYKNPITICSGAACFQMIEFFGKR